MFKDANVTLIVSDMDRAIKFYTETLGLRLLANYGGHFAEVQAPGVKIGLHPGKPAKEASRGMSLGFRVEDYEAAAKELEARGVKFDKTPAGFRVVSSALEVTGWVPEIDAAGFEKAASGAKDNCPISQALKNNVELSVQAKLARG